MFTPYFSYTGNLSVNGAVSAYAMPGGDTMIYYWLGGVDGGCVNGPDTSLSANSCGIHIRACSATRTRSCLCPAGMVSMSATSGA